MKHNIKINFILVLFFVLSQIVGLAVINHYIDHEQTTIESIAYEEMPLGIEAPEQEQEGSFLILIFGILIATALAFTLFKFKMLGLWKLWFFLAIMIALTISLNTIIPEAAAISIAIAFALFKLFRPNFLVHNLTEILIYGGIAAIFIPMISLTSAFIVLILISIYDIIAVNKSKHMIKLANMQTKTKTFAGFSIPYRLNKNKTKSKKVKTKVAILGGGDIIFPLIFSGVVFKNLILVEPIITAFLKTLIITIFCAGALIYLLLTAKKNKFYPAMPYLSIGCFVGYLVLILI